MSDTGAELLPPVDRALPQRADLSVRVIRPRATPVAALLHIHGGGFAFGNSAMEDEGNSALARMLGIATISSFVVPNSLAAWAISHSAAASQSSSAAGCGCAGASR